MIVGLVVDIKAGEVGGCILDFCLNCIWEEFMKKIDNEAVNR